mmetsp:Transcript_69944/g.126024  ORF Transcript_69944/g.126024 Transcript_69944/m.126024 type:complete len:210 (+) Transcript_69944:343-972(+)
MLVRMAAITAFTLAQPLELSTSKAMKCCVATSACAAESCRSSARILMMSATTSIFDACCTMVWSSFVTLSFITKKPLAMRTNVSKSGPFLTTSSPRNPDCGTLVFVRRFFRSEGAETVDDLPAVSVMTMERLPFNFLNAFPSSSESMGPAGARGKALLESTAALRSRSTKSTSPAGSSCKIKSRPPSAAKTSPCESRSKRSISSRHPRA